MSRDRLGALRETSTAAPRDDLLARLDADGYLFLRGLCDPDAVRRVRAAVLDALGSCGWLAGDPQAATPSEQARREEAASDPEYFVGYVAVQRLQAFHELAHHGPLVDLMRRVLDAPVLVHPRKVARIGLPHDDLVVEPHQDYPFNQGTADVLTAWIPLGDCPDELGGLKVLGGSHREGFRAVESVPNVGGLRIATPLDGQWLTADFRAGDVLVFHSLTVHAAKRNTTDRLRLSGDFRYQSADEPIAAGSLLPHFHPHVPAHDELTAGWTSTAAVAVPTEPAVSHDFNALAGPPEPVRSRLVATRSTAGRPR